MKSVALSLTPATHGRVQLLDELRGLAILMIVTYHTCGVTGFPNYTHGELGVDIFLLLSGASLALSNRPDESGRRFLYRRLVRLLPAYWIALTAFWLGGVYVLGRVHVWREVLVHYLCIHEFWGDQYFLSISDPFWFLSLMPLLYVVFALLRRWLGRLDIVLGVGGVLAFLAAWISYHFNQPAVFTQFGLRPGMFFLGIPLGMALRNGRAEIPLTPWLGIGALLYVYGLFFTGLFVGYNAAGLSLFVTYWALRANADAAGSRWLCRGLVWLGSISYELFLLHQPLIREYNYYCWQHLLKVTAPVEWQIAVGVAVGLGLATALAWGLRKVTGRLTRRLVS